MPHDRALGRVRLVGAGPGAADLLTVRAARAVEGAEALLYDALVEPEVLAMAPAACLRIETGKRAGRPSMDQATINRLMLRLARRGLDVVRLKGGDPSVFGRVGEEQAFLAAHGVPVEIVPGVTAACAAAAEFGFPLTHRGEARRVVFATATLKDGAIQGDWAAAGDREATLAVYMGGRAVVQAARAMIAAGRPGATPAALAENVSRPGARLNRTTLACLAAEGAAVGDGPVLLIVGETAGRAQAGPSSEPLVLEAAS